MRKKLLKVIFSIFIKIRFTGRSKIMHCICLCNLFFLGCERKVEFEEKEDVSNFPCLQVSEDNNSCKYDSNLEWRELTHRWSKDNCDVCKTYTWLYKDIHYYLSVFMTQGYSRYPDDFGGPMYFSRIRYTHSSGDPEYWYFSRIRYPHSFEEMMNPVHGLPFITEEELQNYWDNDNYGYASPGVRSKVTFDVWTVRPDGTVMINYPMGN